MKNRWTIAKPEPEATLAEDDTLADEKSDIGRNQNPKNRSQTRLKRTSRMRKPDPEPPPARTGYQTTFSKPPAQSWAHSPRHGPDDYVARLEASPSEWMTITDDSLSNELERELLTSAAAMCLWQELMIWYQGENSSTFTDAFGKIGPVFVRGQSGQWSIVSKLRSILRRLRA